MNPLPPTCGHTISDFVVTSPTETASFNERLTFDSNTSFPGYLHDYVPYIINGQQQKDKSKNDLWIHAQDCKFEAEQFPPATSEFPILPPDHVAIKAGQPAIKVDTKVADDTADNIISDYENPDMKHKPSNDQNDSTTEMKWGRTTDSKAYAEQHENLTEEQLEVLASESKGSWKSAAVTAAVVVLAILALGIAAKCGAIPGANQGVATAVIVLAGGATLIGSSVLFSYLHKSEAKTLYDTV